MTLYTLTVPFLSAELCSFSHIMHPKHILRVSVDVAGRYEHGSPVGMFV
jgi:hypothetical protein